MHSLCINVKNLELLDITCHLQQPTDQRTGMSRVSAYIAHSHFDGIGAPMLECFTCEHDVPAELGLHLLSGQVSVCTQPSSLSVILAGSSEALHKLMENAHLLVRLSSKSSLSNASVRIGMGRNQRSKAQNGAPEPYIDCGPPAAFPHKT